MITEGHCIGSKESHSRRKMNDEEYEREKAEINFHLELLMEMLQMNEEDQRYGHTMKRKFKWHRLQVK